MRIVEVNTSMPRVVLHAPRYENEVVLRQTRSADGPGHHGFRQSL